MERTLRRIVAKNNLFLALAAIVIFSIIFKKNSYLMFLLSMLFLYAIAGHGLDIMVGWTGSLVFCPSALAILGGYTSALLVMKADVPFGLTLLISILLSAIVSVSVASVVLLLDEPVDIMLVTFAFEEIVFYLLQGWHWAGGSMGITNIPSVSIFGLSLNTLFKTFVFIVIVFLIIWLMLFYLYNSRHGKRLRAIRQDPQLLESLGYSATKGRIIAFSLGGGILGLFGALYGALLHTLTPVTFTFETMTLTIFFIIVLGGLGTMLGPILGAIIAVVLPEVFAFAPEQEGIIMAAILMVIIIVFPKGIAGVFGKFEKGK